MEKPQNLASRQYVGLVRGLNSRIAHMPPLFNENQQLEKSEIVDSLANKAPVTHKAVIISQGFNPRTGYLTTFIEHCEQAETTDNITMAKFPASGDDSNTMKNKKRSKKTK